MYKTILFILGLAFFSLLFIACGDDRVSTDGGVHQGIHGTKDTVILQPKDSVIITPD